MTTIAERIPVIDTDTHVIEPPDLWTSRMPSKWGDRMPRVVFDEKWKMDRWLVGDRMLNHVAQYNASGWPEHPPAYPPSLEVSDPGGYDAVARLRKMDEFGLRAQVLYPNLIGFDTESFIALGDPELTMDCVRAYNDFMTDFASADPKRLLPIAMMPYWDIDECLKEMKRCRENGHKGILWPAKLHVLGQPRINSRHWDRVYAAAQDMEMSVNLHVGIGTFTPDDDDYREVIREKFSPGAYVVESAVTFVSNMHTIGTLLVSDVFERFRNLQVVSVESGWGFLPWLLESLDWQWKNSTGPKQYPDRRMPSEKFFTNMYGTFWFEQETLRILETRPEFASRIMYETDYPHPTSLTPGPASAAEKPRDMLEKQFAGIPDDITRKVLHDNAAKLYHVE